MKKLNGCIAMSCSRTKCIELCLKSLHEKFNHKHEYPVYVHYFDDIYSDENFSKHIKETIHPDITFIKVDYEIPSHIPEKELFFFGAIWRLEKINNKYTSVCCLITKQANNEIKYIHDRMPVIFSAKEALNFLNDDKNEYSKSPFKSEIEDELDCFQVSKTINNSKN